MVQQANEAWEVLRDYPHVVDALQQAFAQGRVTREIFAGGPEAIVGEELYRTCEARERRHLELAMVYESTRRLREKVVRTLEPHGIEVRGDAAWASIASKARGNLNYFQDLAPYYRSTAVNINVTSIQMKSAVNQRVFDCPAAGGFLLTDDQVDLQELFAPEETAAYGAPEELPDVAAYFLKHPEKREAVVKAAQRRIRAEHTHAHRLLALKDQLAAWFA
jgi:spore maturation protein CgeB